MIQGVVCPSPHLMGVVCPNPHCPASAATLTIPKYATEPPGSGGFFVSCGIASEQPKPTNDLERHQELAASVEKIIGRAALSDYRVVYLPT